jgi:hypothetical protein
MSKSVTLWGRRSDGRFEESGASVEEEFERAYRRLRRGDVIGRTVLSLCAVAGALGVSLSLALMQIGPAYERLVRGASEAVSAPIAEAAEVHAVAPELARDVVLPIEPAPSRAEPAPPASPGPADVRAGSPPAVVAPPSAPARGPDLHVVPALRGLRPLSTKPAPFRPRRATDDSIYD